MYSTSEDGPLFPRRSLISRAKALDPRLYQDLIGKNNYTRYGAISTCAEPGWLAAVVVDCSIFCNSFFI